MQIEWKEKERERVQISRTPRTELNAHVATIYLMPRGHIDFVRTRFRARPLPIAASIIANYAIRNPAAFIPRLYPAAL